MLFVVVFSIHHIVMFILLPKNLPDDGEKRDRGKTELNKVNLRWKKKSSNSHLHTHTVYLVELFDRK